MEAGGGQWDKRCQGCGEEERSGCKCGGGSCGVGQASRMPVLLVAAVVRVGGGTHVGREGWEGKGALLWESPSIPGQPLNLLSLDSFSVPGQYTPHRGRGGLRCLKGVSELGPAQGCVRWARCWEQSPNVSSRRVQSQGSPPGSWGPGSRNCRCFSSPYDVGQCGAVCGCKYQRGSGGWEEAPEACWDSEGLLGLGAASPTPNDQEFRVVVSQALALDSLP